MQIRVHVCVCALVCLCAQQGQEGQRGDRACTQAAAQEIYFNLKIFVTRATQKAS